MKDVPAGSPWVIVFAPRSSAELVQSPPPPQPAALAISHRTARPGN